MPRVARSAAETLLPPSADEGGAAPAAEATKNKGGRPRKDVTQSPEFQTALAKAKDELRGELLSALQQAKGIEAAPAPANAPAAPVDFSDEKWARGLALAISELTDQGTGRKRVAPEVLVAREEARKTMITLLVQARANGEVPAYQLTGKVYLDEMLVDPMWIGADHRARPTEIDWPGVPNHAMKPINDVAQGIFEQFLKWTGQVVVVPGTAQDSWLTSGGLVVKGAGPRSASRGEAPHTGADHVAEVGLKIRGRGASATPARVLGTVAAPPQQNA